MHTHTHTRTHTRTHTHTYTQQQHNNNTTNPVICTYHIIGNAYTYATTMHDQEDLKLLWIFNTLCQKTFTKETIGKFEANQ